MKRAALGLVALMLVLVAWIAPPALAHVDLLSSTPEDGAVLSELPSEVSLVFSEDLLPETVNVSVTDSVGTVVVIAGPTVDGPQVRFPWPGWPASASGDEWNVNYRVVSKDGHPVSGTVTFTAPPPVVASAPASASAAPAPVASATSTTAVPAASTDSGSSSSYVGPVVAIVIGLAVGVGIGVFFVKRGRRSA